MVYNLKSIFDFTVGLHKLYFVKLPSLKFNSMKSPLFSF